MATITVKVDENLKKMMRRVKINWSEYIREAIRHRIELEERRAAAEKLVEGLKSGKPTVPKGFINKTLRESREISRLNMKKHPKQNIKIKFFGVNLTI